jgi:Holliday junction resolvasome RuvABC ATP-dependent DNA helicase subunit
MLVQEHMGPNFGKKEPWKMKSFSSFDKFAEITLNVARALTTEPKHVVLFGEHGIGKRTVAKAAAKLLGYR